MMLKRVAASFPNVLHLCILSTVTRFTNLLSSPYPCSCIHFRENISDRRKNRKRSGVLKFCSFLEKRPGPVFVRERGMGEQKERTIRSLSSLLEFEGEPSAEDLATLEGWVAAGVDFIPVCSRVSFPFLFFPFLL